MLATPPDVLSPRIVRVATLLRRRPEKPRFASMSRVEMAG